MSDSSDGVQPGPRKPSKRRALSITRADAVSEIGPYGITPIWIALHPKATSEAVHLFTILAGRYADRSTNQCFPGRKRLAADLRCHVRSIDRHLNVLVEVGAVTITERKSSKSGNTHNLYTVHYRKPEGFNLADLLTEVAPVSLGGVDTDGATLATPVALGVGTPVAHDPESGRTRIRRTNKDPLPPASGGTPTTSDDDLLASIFTEPTPEDVTPEAIVALYHERLTWAPKVVALTTKRRAHLKGRLRQHADLSWWGELFARVNASPFLTGSTEAAFKLTIDFLLSEDNLTKILEGKYDARPVAVRRPFTPMNRFTPSATTAPLGDSDGDPWQQALEKISVGLGRYEFHKWFHGTKLRAATDAELLVEVPTELHESWIAKHFLPAVTDAAAPRAVRFVSAS